jgi:plasmid stabilization system protein ParE
MNIRATQDAADDLESIKARVARDDAGAAERIVEQIRATIRKLGKLPRLGHDGILRAQTVSVCAISDIATAFSCCPFTRQATWRNSCR